MATNHKWDADGERCLNCGDKDWFAGPVCSGKKEPTHIDQAIEELEDALQYKNMTCGESKSFIVKALQHLFKSRGSAYFRPTHKHKKRGSYYQQIAVGTIQTESPLPDMANVVIYQGEDGQFWARAYDEFYDGRFEPVTEQDAKASRISEDERGFDAPEKRTFWSRLRRAS